ncbi:hypothetical protein [Planktothrix sp. FACHB-1365]|uniref:hypothetical protein n=1 Tax=Planktothrix sp. FACHB-1365 TaxID=2692855 RepID=UPI001683D489|nr:hypothetical protein [Planktothrix sp. FACHB-1365]MBD2481550.1 hypothetical protein [Planktothrix sp. FACHB-1365]
MYKYTKLNDKIGKIEFDNYNRQQSIIVFLEALIKKEEDYLTVIGILGGDLTNIGKSTKSPDGKWGYDPDFKLTNELPAVKLDIPFKVIEKESKSGKKYTIGSVSENFIAAKLLEDIGDGGYFEGNFDLGADRGTIDKYHEYVGYGQMGESKAKNCLGMFYEVIKIDKLTIITDEILSSFNESVDGNYKSGGKTYPKAETETEKLIARSNYVKRFLSDNWDGNIDMNTITFDSCLAMFEGRKPSIGKDGQTLLLNILSEILKTH